MHAAGESGPATSGTFAVVLEAREDQLEKLEYQLQSRNIPHVAIREPDEPWRGALMAIGVFPTEDRKSLKPILGKLKLFGKDGVKLC